jgi:predicted dehydrogenase
MRKVKLGFVGTGFMGQLAHLGNYAELEDCEIVAVAESRPKLGEEIARRYGVKNVFTNHTELLNSCEVDAIIASQPYGNHVNLVPDILRAGKAVFTEKPLCIGAEKGEELVKLAQACNVLHMVGYHKRSDPAMEYAKTLIGEWKASGEYGKMRLVRITMPPGEWTGGVAGFIGSDEPYPTLAREPYPEYFDKKTGDYYDWFVNYYIHQVNAMRFLFGEPYKLTFADKSGVLLAVESDSGVCGTIEMAPFNTSIDWQETMFVGFEKGFIKVELPAPLAHQQPGRVTVLRDNGKEVPTMTQPILPLVHAMKNQAKNFLAAVRGERPAPCTSVEALEDLKIATEYIKWMTR